MDDFISKPVKIEMLQVVLERWLQLNGRSDQQVPGSELPPTPKTSSPDEPEPHLTSPSIDPQVIQDLRNLGGKDDPEFLHSVIEQFLTDLPHHVAAIQTAISQHDAHALMKAAHACKGNCRQVGATVLAEICLELETMGRTSAVEGILPLQTQLEAEIPRVESALQYELETTLSAIFPS